MGVVQGTVGTPVAQMKSEFRRMTVYTFFFIGIFSLSLLSYQTSMQLLNKQILKSDKDNSNPEEQNTSFIKLEHCPCVRTIIKNSKSKSSDFSRTTCGKDAFQRGSHQKGCFIFILWEPRI